MHSRVGWHCNDEPLFGGAGCSKLIVSVSFGSMVLFKWKGKSCPDSEVYSCCLGHGDVLVMDGQPTCAQGFSVPVMENGGEGGRGV